MYKNVRITIVPIWKYTAISCLMLMLSCSSVLSEGSFISAVSEGAITYSDGKRNGLFWRSLDKAGKEEYLLNVILKEASSDDALKEFQLKAKCKDAVCDKMTKNKDAILNVSDKVDYFITTIDEVYNDLMNVYIPVLFTYYVASCAEKGIIIDTENAINDLRRSYPNAQLEKLINNHSEQSDKKLNGLKI